MSTTSLLQIIRPLSFLDTQIEWGAIGPITKDENGRDRSGDQISVGSFNKYIMFKEKFDSVFNATSANPPGTNWIGAMTNREKPASEGVLDDLILLKKKHSMCHPFRFVNKSWIVTQFHKMNKMDLYNMTRSCEGDITHTAISKVVPDLESYDPAIHTVNEIPKCGECWWCRERKWAEDNV
jgi:hypothetical protein